MNGYEMMKMMVSDWLFDHRDEMSDLILDGTPYYSEDYSAWAQDAHDSTTTYVLVAYDGNVDIQYVGTV